MSTTATRATLTCGECLQQIVPGSVVREGGLAFCPHCRERVCRVCGCTQHNACADGCAWSARDPEVCDAHEGGR